MVGGFSNAAYTLHLYILGCPPSQDASDHQDYFMFRIGDSYKPSFATITGKGDNPMYIGFRSGIFTYRWMVDFLY